MMTMTIFLEKLSSAYEHISHLSQWIVWRRENWKLLTDGLPTSDSDVSVDSSSLNWSINWHSNSWASCTWIHSSIHHKFRG